MGMWGTLWILVGLILMLVNTVAWPSVLEKAWPVIVVAIGTILLYEKSRTWGALWLVVGLALMVVNLAVLPSVLEKAWPMILISIGTVVLYEKSKS